MSPAISSPRPLLIWNASASSQVGMYGVGAASRLEVGDIVAAWPPAAARALAAQRQYLPANVPLVKPVSAVAGTRVCAKGGRVSVGGRPTASRRRTDSHGRLLPWWTGCRRLARGEVLLLSRAGPWSFDGRYFGPTRRGDIVGKARLLWAR